MNTDHQKLLTSNQPRKLTYATEDLETKTTRLQQVFLIHYTESNHKEFHNEPEMFKI